MLRDFQHQFVNSLQRLSQRSVRQQFSMEVDDQIPWPVIERICHHLIRSQSKNPNRGVTDKRIEQMRIPLVVHAESLLSLIMELRSFYSKCGHVDTGMVININFRFRNQK